MLFVDLPNFFCSFCIESTDDMVYIDNGKLLNIYSLFGAVFVVSICRAKTFVNRGSFGMYVAYSFPDAFATYIESFLKVLMVFNIV